MRPGSKLALILALVYLWDRSGASWGVLAVYVVIGALFNLAFAWHAGRKPEIDYTDMTRGQIYRKFAGKGEGE